MVELELGAVDLRHVPADPVVATDDEVEERAEDDTEDHLAPQRRPVAVTGLGIEVVFAGAAARGRVGSRHGPADISLAHDSLRGCARIDPPRQIIDARSKSRGTVARFANGPLIAALEAGLLPLRPASRAARAQARAVDGLG